MKTKYLILAAVSILTIILAGTGQAYLGGFEAQDGYQPFFNDVKGYNAGQYGTNNSGPGGSPVVIPDNTGLWSRLDPVAPGFSYATGHQYRDRLYTNTSGASGLVSDLGLVLTTNHQGWTSAPLNYRYNLDSRDFNGAPVASSANSVVKVSFWWCAQMDQTVGSGYFGDEIKFFDSANKLSFRLGLTERNTGDKVTFWNGATMFESAITAAAGRYDRWDLTFNYVTKTVSADYFEFATSTLHTLVSNVPLADVTANGLDHLEFKTTPGVTNDKLMSVDDFSMEVIKDPDACMEISNGTIGCVPNPAGGFTYTYNFTVTNLSGQFVPNLLVPAVATVPNNGSVTLSPPVIPVNLANGASTTVSVTINGAVPDQQVCFRVALFNAQFSECCSEEICLEMPCVKFTQETIECAPGVTGVVNYSPTIVNTSGGPVKWIEFIPSTPGVQINPGQIDLGSLANNASASVGPLQITGAVPGSLVCFHVVLIDADLHHCCIEEHCIRIPDCGGVAVVLPPLPTGTPAKPCPQNADGGGVPPADCLTICNEKLICETQGAAGGAPCILYTFTVTNQSTFDISNLVFPSAAVTPSQVFFNPPLAPGQASTVTVKICGQPVGSFQFPIVALGLEQGECCSIKHDITLPNCHCLQVLQSSIECIGVDANGTFCYAWSATVQNLEPWIVDHAFLVPDVPSNVTFTPQYFSFPGIGQFGTTTLSSVIKAPGNPSSITFQITIHDANFDHCCAIPITVELPECCDCDITLNFAPTDPAGGQAAPLPAGVSLLNLQQDSSGKIGFPATPKPFPYVYMAASGRGTVVRIDANTGTVLGEFRTVPQSRGSAHSPSRTTVDRFGECWVGNRIDWLNTANVLTGSVMRIGLVIGGTRGNKVPKVGGGWTVTPSPTGQYLEGPFSYTSPSVVDRDGDGLIRTSSGLGDILNWDSANVGTNNTGGVSLADDEGIVTFTRTRAYGVRALAIDANNDLWVGGFPSQNVYGRISGTTGVADWSLAGPNPGIRNIGGGYGALIDANNVLWSVSREGSSSTYGVYRHDLAANVTTFVSAEGCYGIGIDLCDNSIWVSSVYASNETRGALNLVNKFVLRHFNAAGTFLGAYPQPRPAQGLSVDSNGHPFVSGVYYSPGEVWHYSPTGVLLATITGSNIGSTGTAVDHNGKIWVSDFMGDQALRMNPTTNSQEIAVPLGAGATPYNYSDMTGYVSLNAAGQFGMMQYMHDSKCPDTDWGRVSWQTLGEVQKSCTISVEVRASNNALNFPSTWTPVRSMQNFCGRGIKGQYLQVRVIFRRPAGCPPECNPQLCNLRIECCDDISHGPDGGGQGPVISVADVIYVKSGNPVGLRVFASDADGDAMTATLSREGYSASGVVVNGSVVFSVPLNPALLQAGAGREEFTVSVSDGVNASVELVTVVYGDLAPSITAPAGRSIKAFSGVMPDFRPEVVVYDDITPVDLLVITQSPPPGTVVGQGSAVVRLFVTDTAGNVGQSETYFEVAAVVSVGGVVNYQVVDPAASFSPVPVLDGASPDGISRTDFLVDGSVFSTSAGLMAAAPVQLPPGDHRIAFRVFNASGGSSESRPLMVYVLSTGTPEPLPALAIHTGPDGCQLTCTLAEGKTWNLMRSKDLTTWEFVETVTGTGEAITIPFTSAPGTTKEFFRLEEQ
jgi:hypothetical protein